MMDEKDELIFEIKALRKKLADLELENDKLKKIVIDNDLDENDEFITDEEFICINEIRKLKQLSEQSGLTKDDVQALDILHKNLRMIRGKSTEGKKSSKKKASVAELFKIVEDKNA
jgi:hypothetical protein